MGRAARTHKRSWSCTRNRCQSTAEPSVYIVGRLCRHVEQLLSNLNIILVADLQCVLLPGPLCRAYFRRLVDACENALPQKKKKKKKKKKKFPLVLFPGF